MEYRSATGCSCFFFSSRRRHTRLQGDWSSDVCSSDLRGVDVIKIVSADGPPDVDPGLTVYPTAGEIEAIFAEATRLRKLKAAHAMAHDARSEERRVGKESRSRWSPYH